MKQRVRFVPMWNDVLQIRNDDVLEVRSKNSRTRVRGLLSTSLKSSMKMEKSLFFVFLMTHSANSQIRSMWLSPPKFCKYSIVRDRPLNGESSSLLCLCSNFKAFRWIPSCYKRWWVLETFGPSWEPFPFLPGGSCYLWDVVGELLTSHWSSNSIWVRSCRWWAWFVSSRLWADCPRGGSRVQRSFRRKPVETMPNLSQVIDEA